LWCASQRAHPFAWLRTVGNQPEQAECRRDVEEALVGAAQANNHGAKIHGGGNKEERPA
jgi:hypothetical protein